MVPRTQVVEQKHTVHVPEVRYERREQTVMVPDVRLEERERPVTVYRQVPETRAEQVVTAEMVAAPVCDPCTGRVDRLRGRAARRDRRRDRAPAAWPSAAESGTRWRSRPPGRRRGR